MLRGGKGRQLGRWGEQYPNTAVQLMCYNKAAELQAYKCTAGGAGWRFPSWVRAVARAGPIPASPESLEAWPRLSCLPARPLHPLQPRSPAPRGLCFAPHQPVLKAGS